MKIKTKINALIMGVFVISISACSTLSTDYRMVYDNTGVNIADLKRGESCMERSTFTGWTGNATISEAAKLGGISKVKYVENVLIKKRNCIVVYGE